jgi:asparagine synthase (glutamine-hydrolysing)
VAIAGIVRFKESRDIGVDVARMAEAMAPYGADHRDAWNDASVGMLSMPRRAAAGASGPRRTTSLSGGTHVVVADARVDNRAEVAGLLGMTSEEARSTSDVELIRRAYDTWGLELTSHLLGAFAIAIWDPRAETMHCIRDHAGQRPLFYHRGRELFAFASMPTALLGLDDIPCRLDEVKLAEMLLGCHERTDATPFLGVSRLSAGSRLQAKAGAVRVTRYWDVSASPSIALPSDAEYARQARSLLMASTAGHLRSTGPIGVSLSGGLDSSTVACAAAKLLQDEERRITAFHRTPPDGFGRLPPKAKLLHEAEFVEAIAGQYPNVDVAYVKEGAGSPLAGLARRTRYCQRPVLRVANHHWFHSLWSAARRRYIDVLLVGGAGDLTMSWGGRGELAELARRGRWATLAREVPQRAAWLGVASHRVLRTHVVSPLLAELRFRVSAPLSPGRGIDHAVAQSPINRALVGDLNMAQRLRDLGWDTSAPRLLQQRRLRVRQANAYDDAVGEIHAGLEAMYGFEFRDPFRDKRVLEFCFAIPPIQYLAGGADRSLLRRAAAGFVPPSILERRKKGAQAVDWAERLVEAEEEIREEISSISRSPLASHILDVPRMRSIIDSGRVSRWVKERAGATDFESRSAYASLMRDYSGVLLTGIATGMFLRWLEGGCRS